MQHKLAGFLLLWVATALGHEKCHWEFLKQGGERIELVSTQSYLDLLHGLQHEKILPSNLPFFEPDPKILEAVGVDPMRLQATRAKLRTFVMGTVYDLVIGQIARTVGLQVGKLHPTGTTAAYNDEAAQIYFATVAISLQQSQETAWANSRFFGLPSYYELWEWVKDKLGDRRAIAEDELANVIRCRLIPLVRYLDGRNFEVALRTQLRADGAYNEIRKHELGNRWAYTWQQQVHLQGLMSSVTQWQQVELNRIRDAHEMQPQLPIRALGIPRGLMRVYQVNQLNDLVYQRQHLLGITIEIDRPLATPLLILLRGVLHQLGHDEPVYKK